MPRIASHTTLTPSRMSPAARSALADALYAAVGEVFDTDKATATRLILEPASQRTRIRVARNEGGEIVGMFALHFFERSLEGRPVTVVRVQSGTLRAYRGRSADMPWVIREVLAYALSHPGRALYGMGLMIHPSSYLFVARYAPTYWPRPDEPVPPEVLALMIGLADEFALKRVDLERPLVRASTLLTRETEVERAYWQRCEKPAARFYLTMNPDYSQRRGLLVLGRLGVRQLLAVAGRFVRDRAGLALEGALTAAQRLPLGASLIRRHRARRRLRADPLFAGLDEPSLAALAAEAEVLTLATGAVVLREGDEGDDLYLVTRGAVAVAAPAAEGEAVLEQLGVGAVFGELAVQTGGRRKTTVRAAIPSTLVRIGGAALRSLMARDEAVARAIGNARAR